MVIKCPIIFLCVFGLILIAALVSPFPVHAAAQATIVSSTGYVDSLGYYHVVGEVKNTGDVPLQFVRVTATFYNVSNIVVGTDSGYSYIDVLEAGRKSPFDVMLLDRGQSAKVDHYSLNLSFEQAQSKPRYLQILSNSSYTDSLKFLHVVGEIKNNGVNTTRFVKVAATFYGGDGKVVETDFTYTSPSDIPVGGTAPFDIFISSDRASLVKSYALEAQSSEYNLIPEFQNPLLILILGVIIAILATRKTRLRQTGRICGGSGGI